MGFSALNLLLALPPTLGVSLTGLWTTVPVPDTSFDQICDEFFIENCFDDNNPPLHDAIRVADDDTVTCEHGGYYNMTELDCLFDTGSLTEVGDQVVIR